MERKLKLLQVLREGTAIGRQAVVCGAGARLASPLASLSFSSLGGALRGPWVSCYSRKWVPGLFMGARPVQVSLSLRLKGKVPEVGSRGAWAPSTGLPGWAEEGTHAPPPKHIHSLHSFIVLRGKLVSDARLSSQPPPT